MSHTIELPDSLFREITGYAVRVAVSPTHVIQRAWEEFQQRHESDKPPKAMEKTSAAELKGLIKSLRGSISLPPSQSCDEVLEEALTEKYGRA